MAGSGGGDTEERKCILLVLCGLPASGKTSLATELQNELSLCNRNDFSHLSFNVYHICYDQLMPPELEKQLIEEAHSNDKEKTHWKAYRRAILSNVENHVAKLVLGDGAPQIEIPEYFSERFAGISNQCTAQGQNIRDLFIIDDNMYYSGMRYEYYQLAKKYNVSFAEVFFHCSLDLSLQRNEARQIKVSEKVIKEMTKRMEPPDDTNSWEKYSIVVNGEKDILSQLDSVICLISTSLQDPVKDLVADLEKQKEESRNETSASSIHQVDNLLRRAVAEIIKDAKSKGMSGNHISVLSGKLKHLKPEILQQFKDGCLYVTQDEIRESLQNPFLYQRLKLIMEEKLN